MECQMCPHKCKVDRVKALGRCKAGINVKIRRSKPAQI